MLVLVSTPGAAQVASCEEGYSVAPETAPLPPKTDEDLEREARLDQLWHYVAVERGNRLTGLASYYSRSLDGTLTADGEIYRNRRYSAAHLTLPLGTWIEVRSRATGRKIRLRVNDRGPYVRKFVIDLSRAAAHELGVDVTEDRTVYIRILRLPGEEPLPKQVVAGPVEPTGEEAGW